MESNKSDNLSSIYTISDQLPTVKDVVHGIDFIIAQKKNGSFYHTSIKEFLPSMTEHIIALWEKARIPTMTKKHVRYLIDKKRSEYLKALKRQNMQKSRSSNVPPSPDYVKMMDKLFDISHCKCYRKLTNAEEISNIICNCSAKMRIPEGSIRFYFDQLTSRQLLISSLITLNTNVNESLATDISAVSISDSTDVAISSQTHLNSSLLNNSSPNKSINTTVSEASSIYVDDIIADPDYELSRNQQIVLNNENVSKIDLTDIAMICDAKQVSAYAAASIISATLSAQKKADNKEKSLRGQAHIVTPNALRTALKRERLKIGAQNNRTSSGMHCFQFDGKICNTLVSTGSRNELRKIDYLTVVKQPGDIFVASIPVTSSSANDIFICMKDYFTQNNISINNVLAIGCDGAPVNTGVEHGIIRRFEELLERPLQWLICLLRLNELAFHRLFKFLDNSSCSPSGYSSELGNQLLNCEKLKPVKFKRIELDFNRLPLNIDDWHLTNDQKYLLELAKAINSGYLNDVIAKQKPGVMNKARWVTTMARILRLYVSLKNPSKVISILALYIIKIYIPVLLSIKENPSFVHGSRHLHLLICLSQEYFDKPEYEAIYQEIKKTITNNGYFAHSENILMAMITDKDIIIRKMGYDYIILSRLTRRVEEYPNVRFFEKPIHINFNARHYYNLINMNLANIIQPPILHKYELTIQELQILSDADDIIEIDEIPSHTQATERYVQVTAQQVRRTSNVKLQQGAIHNTADFRKLTPKFRSSTDFKLPSTTSTNNEIN